MPFNTQPLGTVIASMLDFDDFTRYMGESADFEPSFSTYVPCDGREIVGSRLAINMRGRMNFSPDLRGQFLRGLNVMKSEGQPDPIEERWDRTDDRNRGGQYQADAIKDHVHEVPAKFQEADGGDQFRGMGLDSNSNQSGDHRNGHDRSPYYTKGNLGGAIETRPRNVTVFYYMKIN
jgi:hypothetical protein